MMAISLQSGVIKILRWPERLRRWLPTAGSLGPFLPGRFPQGQFLQNVLVLSGSSAASQVLLVLAFPILARLHTPESIGIWQLFVGVVATFSVGIGLRYELAMLLPESDQESVDLFALSIVIAVLLTSVLFLAAGPWADELAAWLALPHGTALLGGACLAVLLAGATEAASYRIGRRDGYGPVAVGRLSRSVVTIGVPIAWAVLFGGGTVGLILGSIAGQMVAAVLLLGQVLRRDAGPIRAALAPLRLLRRAWQYRVYPACAVPYTISGALAPLALLAILKHYTTLHEVGLVAVAMRLVKLPVTWVSSAMSQALYVQVAPCRDLGRLNRVVLRILGGMTLLWTPFLVVFCGSADLLLGTVLGAGWVAAGKFATALAWPAFALFHTAWLDRLFDVCGRQRLSLTLQVGSDALGLLLLLAAFRVGLDVYWAIVVYSAWVTIYNGVWLVVTFRIAGLPLGGLSAVAGKFVLVLVPWLALVGTTQYGLEESAALGVQLAALGVHAVWAVARIRRWISHERVRASSAGGQEGVLDA